MSRQRIIIDCDPGQDDAVALFLAMASPGELEILGKIFQPLMFLLSIPWEEAEAAGALFGEKIILNEFVAFSHLNDYLAGMSPRTIAVSTFALCGFANLSSIAILLGGLVVLVPEKREVIGRFGIKAVLAASLSNLMSAALAGLMLTF